MRLPLTLLMAFTTAAASAADIPRLSSHDPRVRYVSYKPDDVVVVNVRRGVVTRLILEADERIVTSGTGFAAQCDRDELEWCIRAERETNQVWVKPRERATHNNLELATTKRDYSIRFNVLPDSRGEAGNERDTYRVIFQYPVPPLPPLAQLLAANPTPAAPPDPRTEVATRLAARPVVRNSNYSMAAIGGGEAIAPTVAFDDARFTYLRFPGNREVPAVFHVLGDGSETLVNARMEDDLLVVDRVSRKLMLRAGSAVVGLWNEAFDLDGRPPGDGTTVPGVQRVLKADAGSNNAPTGARKGATP